MFKKGHKYSLKHGLGNTRLHKIWHSMYCRCYYPSTHGYKNYGGRGITICEEWLKVEGFLNFYNWALENGYRDDLTLDRIDVNGNYEPSNCKWATKEEQSANMRVNRRITYNGKTKTLTQWARQYNINVTTLSDRLKTGMPIDKALTKPVIKSGGYLFYTMNNETKLLSEWCKIYNINYETAWKKAKAGQSIEKILKLNN